MKTVIVTGATGGIGSVLSCAFAEQGCKVIMACRNTTNGQKQAASIVAQTKNKNVQVMSLDLASLDSVKNFAQAIAAQGDRISLLVNNAGILTKSDQRSADGYSLMMAVNFIGTAVLTLRLLPLLTDGAKIINMLSLVYRFGQLDVDFFAKDLARRPLATKFSYYADSKLANMLFVQMLAKELASQNSRITINGVEPGIVSTNMITMDAWFDPLTDLLFRPLIRSPQKGAEGILHLAALQPTPHTPSPNGELFKDSKMLKIPAWVRDYTQGEDMMRRLRELMNC